MDAHNSSDEEEKIYPRPPARIEKYFKGFQKKDGASNMGEAIDAQLEDLREEETNFALDSFIPLDLERHTQDKLESLYGEMKENQSFKVVQAEGNGPDKLMKLAAKYPKSSVYSTFTFGANYDLKKAQEQIPLNTKSMLSKIATFGRSNRFTRIRDLIITYKPLVSSHMGFVGKTTFHLKDTRLVPKLSIIREIKANNHLDSSMYMSMDYFVPTKDFHKVVLQISNTFTGVSKDESFASLWIHGNLEHSNHNYQSAVTLTHSCVSVPTSMLLSKGERDPTKYNSFITAKSMSQFRKSYADLERRRRENNLGMSEFKDSYYTEDPHMKFEDIDEEESTTSGQNPKKPVIDPVILERFELRQQELDAERQKYGVMSGPNGMFSYKRDRPRVQTFQKQPYARPSGYMSEC
jgi:hypothetical protein